MLNNELILYKDFGHIELKLDKILKDRNITTYELSMKTGIKYQTIKNMREPNTTVRINLEVLAKLCYVLGCKIEDLLEYVEA